MSKADIAENVITELRRFAKLYSVDSLFVVGGYCRAKILNDPEDINDIDVASAYPHQAMRLCGLFASEILRTTPRFYTRTGTGVVEYKGLKVEFQNQSINTYMHNEDILLWMRKKGISNTPLLNNVYGRDLTINSLIYSISNGELYDITGRAVDDLQNKIIDTILPGELIIKYNPSVVLRAIHFACRYDFNIVPPLRKLMKKQRGRLEKAYSQEHLTKEIDKILRSDTKRGLKELQKFNLFGLVIPDQLQQYLKEVNDERD